MQYRALKPDRLIQTQDRLAERISARFPNSGLSGVAREVGQITEVAAERAEQIRDKPLVLRAVVGLIALGLLFLLTKTILTLRVTPRLNEALNFVQFVEALLGATVFLGAAAIFLLTIETRLKRRRALSALHELRAVAHVIDMHQLTKDPERILRRLPTLTPAPEQTTHTLNELNRYLSYCTELLAIVSKVAAVYVQDFPDGSTVSAVDQVENLCSGLTNKIFQKINIVERLIRAETERETSS